MTDVEQPLERPAAAPPPRRPHPVRTFLVQLVTITVGVLIALFFEGLVDWNNNRALVRQARAMIKREITDNKREIDGTLAEVETRKKHLANALRLANDLLHTKKSDVRELSLARSFAQLSSASWQTAERTGALAHMDYDEVQRYSALYAFQEVFTTHQHRALERMAAVGAVVAHGSPHEAPAADLEKLREQVMALHGDLLIETDLAKTLSAHYGSELKR